MSQWFLKLSFLWFKSSKNKDSSTTFVTKSSLRLSWKRISKYKQSERKWWRKLTLIWKENPRINNFIRSFQIHSMLSSFRVAIYLKITKFQKGKLFIWSTEIIVSQLRNIWGTFFSKKMNGPKQRHKSDSDGWSARWWKMPANVWYFLMTSSLKKYTKKLWTGWWASRNNIRCFQARQ